MRIVAVEEHFTYPDLLNRIDCATLVGNGWLAPGTTMFQAINPPALGAGRSACLAGEVYVSQKLQAPANPQVRGVSVCA
jgi:hypothetical protein